MKSVNVVYWDVCLDICLSDRVCAVNDMSEVNIIEAQLIHRADEKLVELSNGCICCTLREDLIETLYSLLHDEEDGQDQQSPHQSEEDDGNTTETVKGRRQPRQPRRQMTAKTTDEIRGRTNSRSLSAVIIESTGIAEPIHIAETFANSRNIELKPKERSGDSTIVRFDANKVYRLDTMITVVDCSSFFHHFKPTTTAKTATKGTSFFEKSHKGSDDGDGVIDGPVTGQPNDEMVPEVVRTLTDLLIDQIQFADVILLNKLDLVTTDDYKQIVAVVKDMNPYAKIMPCKHGNINVSLVINTNLFSFEKAEEHAEWFATEWDETVPETEEYGISSFVFRARRPFHPKRLADVLLGCENRSHATSSSSATVGNHACISGAFRQQVVRSKGFVWLADQNEHFVLVHVTGGSVHFSKGKKWWANCPEKDRPNKDPAFQSEVLAHWDPTYGDRGQTLVVIGLHMNKQQIEQELQSALLTEDEMKQVVSTGVPDEVTSRTGKSTSTSTSTSTLTFDLPDLHDHRVIIQ